MTAHREFDSAYLDWTRRGMWADSTGALEPLGIERRDRILDVGSGTGHLTGVLESKAPDGALIMAADVDRQLLEDVNPAPGPAVQAAAKRLPFDSNTVDLVTCQALLVNLADPIDALEEFSRVASGAVAAIEPDNTAVSRTSSVAGEATIDRSLRQHFVAGSETEVAPGPKTLRTYFERAGLGELEHRRYHHETSVEPPYGDPVLTDAKRRVTAEELERHRPVLLNGPLTPSEFDDLKAQWQAIGREMATQVQRGTYRREEVVPFDVIVGRVG